MAILDNHHNALMIARPPAAPGSLDLLKELVTRMSAIWETVIVSIKYPREARSLKKCIDVAQYLRTVLAANLSNLPA